jgi:alpha-1,6-mannosyltransferase
MSNTINVARRCAQGLLILTSLSALILCPHSKVEESFQLQATHDVYYHGLQSIATYDHLQYPGVVPRTFVGPLILATLCRLVTMLLYPILDVAAHPLAVQMVARGLLLTLVCHAWFRMAEAASTGSASCCWRGTYLLLLTAVQFHMPFYASRMLPNTFALVLVLHAYSDWLLSAAETKVSSSTSSNRLIQRSAVWLVTATAIFRCDVLLLLFSVGLVWLIQQQLTMLQALRLGILTGIACLAITVPLDSYMWQTFPIWPEGQVFYYNTVMGKSSDWGVSPWYWYLTSALPKAMLLTTLLLPFAILRLPEKVASLFYQKSSRSSKSNNDKELSTLDTTMLPYLVAATAFIGLYSCLGHKEMRFMFPIMPILNLAAAVGLERLHQVAFTSSTVTTVKDKVVSSPSSWLAKVVYIGALLGCCGVTLVASLAFIGVSRHNYPGGTALQLLVKHTRQQQSASQDREILVHLDVAAAMTGVSLFGQRAAGSTYSFVKAGYEEELANTADDYSRFTHLLSETKDIDGFRVIATSPGHPRLDWRMGRIATEDGIYVLERIISD